jgi:hypothetical protein
LSAMPTAAPQHRDVNTSAANNSGMTAVAVTATAMAQLQGEHSIKTPKPIMGTGGGVGISAPGSSAAVAGQVGGPPLAPMFFNVPVAGAAGAGLATVRGTTPPLPQIPAGAAAASVSGTSAHANGVNSGIRK